MGYFEVITGRQTWSDYVSSKEQVKGFGKALQTQTKGLEKVVKVGLANQKEYQTALKSGLGAIQSDISDGMSGLSNSMQFGFDRLSGGLDRLNADFNLSMGDVIWKLEVQNDKLASIVETLQAPLDTLAKELRKRAEDAYNNGWYVEALKDFLKAANKNYQDFAVHRSIGNIYLYHLIDLPKALQYFRNAAKYSRPRDSRQAAEAEYFAGVVCSLQQDFTNALEHARAATELNPEFYDAFYMRAGFAGMLGDAGAATENLETAVGGDARYHERAKTSPVFEKVRPQVQSLLDRMMEEVRGKAEQNSEAIENLRGRCDELLPKDQQRMSQFFERAEKQLRQAETYQDYLLYLPLLQQAETQLRRAEEQKQFYDKSVGDKYRRELNDANSCFSGGAIGAVILYLIVSVGGCVVRNENEIEPIYNSYLREGIAVALASVIAGIIGGIILRKKARKNYETALHSPTPEEDQEHISKWLSTRGRL
jgi:ElaB/YqjD/DUF883 family membrane-anchored ribosome-binding protein